MGTKISTVQRQWRKTQVQFKSILFQNTSQGDKQIKIRFQRTKRDVKQLSQHRGTGTLEKTTSKKRREKR